MTAQTWHHGLVARWWAEFNRDGDDIEFFQRAIEQSGEPVLDAGCGTGRVLIPLLQAGIDIDGSDTAPDMLTWCESELQRLNLTTTLYHAAMHEIAPSRKYQTVFVCGAFGIGGTRDQDLEGLRRIRECLLPGGTFIMDHYLPNFGKRSWDTWVTEPEFPSRFSSKADRRTAQDGTELELNSRVLDFNPLDQTTRREIRVRHFTGAPSGSDEMLAEESYEITINVYLKPEIELMLRVAGFENVQVTGGLEKRDAEPWRDDRIVFTAIAPGG